jgi:hypothetical protein
MATHRIDHLSLDVLLHRDLVRIATSTEGVIPALVPDPALAPVLVLPFTRGMMAEFIVAEIDARHGVATRMISTNMHEIAGLTNISE